LPKFLTERAKVASILEYGINAGGRTLGLMPDFYDQVLVNIKILRATLFERPPPDERLRPPEERSACDALEMLGAFVVFGGC
jgi:hypothetical protein